MAIGVNTRRWTRDEYYKIFHAGILGPGERVELIEGQIVPTSPHDPLHSNCVGDTTSELTQRYGSTHSVRVQLPLSLGARSEPEPDFALIARDEARRLSRERLHPTGAVLVIEVANSTLAYDRSAKASLYASAGIQDYWIINLVDSCVEVYRGPRPEAEAIFGFNYGERRVFARGQSITPLASQTPVSVEALLPPVD